MRQHRRIDAWTDSHPGVRELRRRFPAPGRRLAGVAIDLWFDVVLARHWRRFSAIALEEFASGVHGALARERAVLTPAARRHADALREHAVLERYADAALAEGALRRIGARLGLEESAASAAATATALLPSIEGVFLELYPEALSVESGRT